MAASLAAHAALLLLLVPFLPHAHPPPVREDVSVRFLLVQETPPPAPEPPVPPPPEALRARQQGTVLLRVKVTAEGSVSDVVAAQFTLRF